MSRRREYIAARYDRGTGDRVDSLSDYIAGKVSQQPLKPAEVTRSEILRELVGFGLEVFERRASAWRAEQEAPRTLTSSDA